MQAFDLRDWPTALMGRMSILFLHCIGVQWVDFLFNSSSLGDGRTYDQYKL